MASRLQSSQRVRMNVLIYIHRLWRKELGKGGEGRVGLKENEHKNVFSFFLKSVSKRKKDRLGHNILQRMLKCSHPQAYVKSLEIVKNSSM